MSQETHTEDQTILSALAALESGKPADEGLRSPEAAGEEAETLARLYREVLGLVPYELDPAAPRPEAKRRLMALVEGEETQEVRGAPEAISAAAARPAQPAPSHAPVPPVPPAASARPAPVPTPAPAPVPVPEPAARRVAAPPPPRRASRWPLALAATLAVALLGLSGWLYLGWAGQRETIADLEQQVRDLRRQVQESDRALQDASSKLHELRGNFSLVTQHAVEVSPMQPVGDSPQPDARGMLFVAPDHQHWYLSVQNLQPPGPGKQYQLWFMAKDVPVSGGVFTAATGERAQLSSAEMPADTTGAMITLEVEGGAPVPTGTEVLRVTKVFQIL